MKHNIPLLRDVVRQPRFKAGDISTFFLTEQYPDGFPGTAARCLARPLAALLPWCCLTGDLFFSFLFFFYYCPLLASPLPGYQLTDQERQNLVSSAVFIYFAKQLQAQRMMNQEGLPAVYHYAPEVCVTLDGEVKAVSVTINETDATSLLVRGVGYGVKAPGRVGVLRWRAVSVCWPLPALTLLPSARVAQHNF